MRSTPNAQRLAFYNPLNKGKFQLQDCIREFSTRGDGGEEGIRTLETVPRLHTFQACAFDHSATSPPASIVEIMGGVQPPDCEKMNVF